MRVLIVKLTSMGDLIHTLPAVTDAVNAIPSIEFDWVVDQAFAEVPLWHANVKNVITTAHRQWRKAPLSAWKAGYLSAFYRALTAKHYDAVIDLQGNIKSACVSWLCKGDVHGLDKASCREYPAHWAYAYRYRIDVRQHVIARWRQLMAKALAYDLPAQPVDYGINLALCSLPKLDFNLPERYIICVHHASWPAKLWPVSYWQALIKHLVKQGYSVLLSCGNDKEHERARQIATASSHALVLPILSLSHVAALMLKAKGAVCSDTGLAHLAAVAGVPAITLYGVTHPEKIGTQGNNQYHIVSDLLATSAKNVKRDNSLAMRKITVEQVFHKLDAVLSAQ